MDYSQYIGKHVSMEVTNTHVSSDTPNGHIGCTIVALQEDGILIHCSVGGQMTHRVMPYSRVVRITPQ